MEIANLKKDLHRQNEIIRSIKQVLTMPANLNERSESSIAAELLPLLICPSDR